MQKLKKAAAAVLTLLLFVAGCGGSLNPEEYIADHGISITGNGSYDVSGDSVRIESVTDGENGWKQLCFVLAPGAAIDDFYIVALKEGVSVDSLELYDALSGELLLSANFDYAKKFGGSFGWKVEKSGGADDGGCITASKAAKELLYFVEDGEYPKNTASSLGEIGKKYDSCRLSVMVKYDWSAEDYDSLFYIGVNELGE